ncbi:MAG: YkvA family protein [Coleofasciculus sp. B1-GNL1-01]|uniref:YkvA family protein n=1 Tax=Coleofasciculus sp. B1-GNL1-01 TaxID=3068484 RepID=UPI0032FAD628
MLDQLKQQARRLKIELYALYLAYRDHRVPWYAKIFAACVVAYAFSPIDLIPDFIPVLGYLDDLILIPVGIKLALKMIPPQIMSKYRKQVQTNLPNSKPKNWIAAATIVIVWLLLAITTIRWMLQLI